MSMLIRAFLQIVYSKINIKEMEEIQRQIRVKIKVTKECYLTRECGVKFNNSACTLSSVQLVNMRRVFLYQEHFKLKN